MMPTRANRLMKPLAKIVGKRLRTRRKAQWITLAELAVSSQVNIATISRIERGRALGAITCHLKLATALGLTLSELYAGLEQELRTTTRSALSRHPLTLPPPAEIACASLAAVAKPERLTGRRPGAVLGKSGAVLNSAA